MTDTSSPPAIGDPRGWHHELVDVALVTDYPIPIEVQAAFKYLSSLHFSVWAEWDISHPDRRYLAAKWLAEQFKAMDQILRSNEFRPI